MGLILVVLLLMLVVGGLPSMPYYGPAPQHGYMPSGVFGVILLIVVVLLLLGRL